MKRDLNEMRVSMIWEENVLGIGNSEGPEWEHNSVSENLQEQTEPYNFFYEHWKIIGRF